MIREASEYHDHPGSRPLTTKAAIVLIAAGAVLCSCHRDPNPPTGGANGIANGGAAAPKAQAPTSGTGANDSTATRDLRRELDMKPGATQKGARQPRPPSTPADAAAQAREDDLNARIQGAVVRNHAAGGTSESAPRDTQVANQARN